MEQIAIPPGKGRPGWQLRRERGWTKPVVSWTFGSCQAVSVHSDVTIEAAQAAVVRAADTWNEVGLPVQLQLTQESTTADIVVDWQFSSQDPEAILRDNIQAHADFPPGNTLFGNPLPVHFNADFLWGIETSGRFDIQTVALHELAHCLGLIYHSGLDTVMYDALGQAPLFVRHAIDAETLARIQSLYALES